MVVNYSVGRTRHEDNLKVAAITLESWHLQPSGNVSPNSTFRWSLYRLFWFQILQMCESSYSCALYKCSFIKVSPMIHLQKFYFLLVQVNSDNTLFCNRYMNRRQSYLCDTIIRPLHHGRATCKISDYFLLPNTKWGKLRSLRMSFHAFSQAEIWLWCHNRNPPWNSTTLRSSQIAGKGFHFSQKLQKLILLTSTISTKKGEPICETWYATDHEPPH